MNWIVASLLMYINSVFFYTSLRHFQKRAINNTLLNFISFFIYALILGGYAILAQIPLDFPLPYFLLTIVAIFIFSYLGNTLSLIGTQYAPNSGYSLIIQKSYAIFTAVASVFLFGSTLTTKSILIVIIFLAVMSYDAETKKHKTGKRWILASFGTFFAFGGLTLYTKWLLNIGISVMSRTVWGAVIVATFFGFELLYKASKNKLNPIPKLAAWEYLLLILMGLFLGLFNLFLNEALTQAPNVGYVNIINGSSIIMITVLAAVIFKDKLSWQKIIGLIGATFGLILLFI